MERLSPGGKPKERSGPLAGVSLDPLRNRDFRLLFVGQTTSTLGSSVAVVALAFAVLDVTGSVADVGLVLAATRLPLALFVLVGGVAGDRLPRRAVMLWADAVRFVTQGAAAALLLSGRAQLWHLLVLFGIHGAAQAFFNPSQIGLVPELVEGERLQEANALMELGRNSSALLGQVAGGVLTAAVGPGSAFAVDSATFGISAASLWLLAAPGIVRTTPPGRFLRELADGWSEFVSRQWLWIGVLHVALLNAFALVAFFALGPVVAKQSLGGGAAAWGVIGAAFGAGMIVGSLVALRWRPRRPLVAAFGVVVLAAPQLALLAIAAPTAAIAAASFFGGAQASVWSTLWTTTMQAEVRPEALARVAAYGSVGTLVLAPLGFAVVGLVADAVGVGNVLWAGAAWVVASTVVVVVLPSIRMVIRTPAAQPA